MCFLPPPSPCQIWLYPFYIKCCVGFFVLFWGRVEKQQNEVKMQTEVEQPYFRGVALQQSFIVSVLYSKICKPKTNKQKAFIYAKKKKK